MRPGLQAPRGGSWAAWHSLSPTGLANPVVGPSCQPVASVAKSFAAHSRVLIFPRAASCMLRKPFVFLEPDVAHRQIRGLAEARRRRTLLRARRLPLRPA